MPVPWPEQTWWRQPNPKAVFERFPANASGLSLLAKGADFRRFELEDVEAGSPAELAGVHKGDVVVGLNGKSASERDLAKINEVLEQDGRTIQLTILRHGRTIHPDDEAQGADLMRRKAR
jgi:C-terminal processing protease CtpA/Prc